MKNISVALIILQFFSLVSPVFADESAPSEKKKFIVTAYYSPLPNQSFYLRGSYEADIRLNGNGTHGASGRAVYPGMLAAPKTYSFGTKIQLEGLGVGTVDDRGGAIVSSGSRGYDADRLDIWMGQGEEGLRRALSWGKRSVTGKILDMEEAVDREAIDLSRVKVAKISANAYRKQQEEQNTLVAEAADIFSTLIDRNTDPEKIKELQIILSRLSYYGGGIDGKYSKALEDAIYDFQIETGLVTSKKTLGAGYYGTKTRTKLKEIYALYTANEKKRLAEEARLAQVKADEEKRVLAEKQEVALFVQNLGSPKADEIGKHVRSLQQSLKSLGYFDGKDTAIFGKNTRAALVAYQTERKIAETELGKLGKSTKEALYKDLLTLKGKKTSGLAWNDRR